DALAAYLVRQMKVLGFEAERDEAGNAVGTVGDRAAPREIVLLGHMDTVPGLIPLREEGGRLYGRGAVDAKGPLAAFVLAAARVAPHLDGARVTVIGAVEEESHGRGARHLAATRPAPECTIIGEPSSWQGVTIGYKGLLVFDYRRTQPGAHSAGEVPGPAERAVALWNNLMMYAAERNGGRSGHFDTLDPALRDFQTSSDGLYNGVDMRVVLRLPPGLHPAELRHEIGRWANGDEITFYPSDPPFEASKNTPLVRAMLQAIRGAGGKPRFKLKTGTSDMNIVGPAWGCPIVAYGPGDSSLDHTPDEHVEIGEFLGAIDVLEHALESLACQ
ncbi:MAG TPA: [LysW]-lysine hydrolase, partial [Alphaproteobacteria bacterium]|nr:[LysW]-lysine hydrolase [Alphaproteobacteria bacterium]